MSAGPVPDYASLPPGRFLEVVASGGGVVRIGTIFVDAWVGRERNLR